MKLLTANDFKDEGKGIISQSLAKNTTLTSLGELCETKLERFFCIMNKVGVLKDSIYRLVTLDPWKRWVQRNKNRNKNYPKNYYPVLEHVVITHT